MSNEEQLVVITFTGTGKPSNSMRGREEEDTLRQRWLDTLQKGDEVVIRFKRGIEFEYYRAIVDLVADDDGRRRIYADGSVFNAQGKWFDSHFLVRPTVEAMEEVERTRLLGEMTGMNWRRLPISVLTKMVELARAETPFSEFAKSLAPPLPSSHRNGCDAGRPVQTEGGPVTPGCTCDVGADK
jgi:hypothetical protein